LRRYVTTLFRLKELFLIPIITVPAIALIVTFYTGREYRVQAKIWVDPSGFLTSTTSGSGQRTPSVIEAGTLTEWMSTESFRTEIIKRSGLQDAIDEGLWPVPAKLGEQVAGIPVVRSIARAMGVVTPAGQDEAVDLAHTLIERQIVIASEGNNLLSVRYTGVEPYLGKRLIEEGIILYNEKTAARQQSDSVLSVEFYGRQAELQLQKLNAAEAAERSFLISHPEPIGGQNRPASELSEIARLARTVALERTLYEDALRKLEQVRIQGEAAISNRNESFAVVDLPEIPPKASLAGSALILNLIVGLTLGGMITGAGVIMLTWTDRTVRTKEDIEETVKIPLVEQISLISGFNDRKNIGVRSAFTAVLAPLGDQSMALPVDR
jgi:uncharacterized protein involved in exopolysaccharide biosynthesis